jgi:hypothetical protein
MVAVAGLHLAVQGGWLAGEIADGHAQLRIVVDVGGIDAHPGEGDAALIHDEPRLYTDLAERAIAVVGEEQAGGEVVGHHDIRPAIPIVIDDRDPQHPCPRRLEPYLCGHIAKPSISEVTVERQALAGKVLNGAVILLGCAVGAVKVCLLAGVPVHIMADDQVQEAIAVVVEEDCCAVPCALLEADLLRGLTEGAIAIILEKQRLQIACHQHILIAIVVIVGGGEAHAIERHVEASRRGHIGERAVSEVAIQLHGGLGALSFPRPAPPIDQQDIDQAVAIVIEKPAAGAHRFRVPLLPGGPGLVSKDDAGRGGHIGKMDGPSA